jgi:hypothetical protein
MGQTAGFAAGSWIVRQAPGTCITIFRGRLVFQLISVHPETPDEI